uniref:Translation initiation factor IF-2-like n=1 Tax=Macrostomum lignano TaxID=282301 RepID=A0A1I8FD09_9PLAT
LQVRRKTATGEAFASSSRELGFRARQTAAAPTPLLVVVAADRRHARAKPVASTPWPSPGASGRRHRRQRPRDRKSAREVSRARLALLAGDPRASFAGQRLRGPRQKSASQVIIGVLCDGGDLRGASGRTASAIGELQLKPGCQRRCPRGFPAGVPLRLHPGRGPCHVTASSRAPSRRSSFGRVAGVPRHVTLKPARSKVCRKACPGWQETQTPPGVAASASQSARARTSPRRLRTVAATASCGAAPGWALNKAALRVSERRLLSKGYELRRDRKCYRTGCDPGFKRTKEGGCKKDVLGQSLLLQASMPRSHVLRPAPVLPGESFRLSAHLRRTSAAGPLPERPGSRLRFASPTSSCTRAPACTPASAHALR